MRLTMKTKRNGDLHETPQLLGCTIKTLLFLLHVKVNRKRAMLRRAMLGKLIPAATRGDPRARKRKRKEGETVIVMALPRKRRKSAVETLASEQRPGRRAKTEGKRSVVAAAAARWPRTMRSAIGRNMHGTRSREETARRGIEIEIEIEGGMIRRDIGARTRTRTRIKIKTRTRIKIRIQKEGKNRGLPGIVAETRSDIVRKRNASEVDPGIEIVIKSEAGNGLDERALWGGWFVFFLSFTASLWVMSTFRPSECGWAWRYGVMQQQSFNQTSKKPHGGSLCTPNAHAARDASVDCNPFLV
jgi:hypothetical protein